MNLTWNILKETVLKKQAEWEKGDDNGKSKSEPIYFQQQITTFIDVPRNVTILKTVIYYDVTLYILVEAYRHFKTVRCFHDQSRCCFNS